MRQKLSRIIVISSLVIQLLAISQSAFAGGSSKNRKLELELERLPIELKMMFFDLLIREDETSLLNLWKSSPLLKQDIQNWGYHPELVEIESLEQLERDYSRNSRLLDVKFITSTLSKAEIRRCLLNPRLKLVERIDVKEATALTPDERSEIENSIMKLENSHWALETSYSHDGTRIITGSFSRTAHIWDSGSGELVGTFSGHARSVLSASFSPDGKKIITGSADRTARIWDIETGELVHTLSGHTGTVRSVAFSPDGSQVITGSHDHTARIWDSQTGQPIYTLVGHASNVHSVAFSPDGKRIITGSADQTANIWSSKTGDLLFTLLGHTRTISSASFSPDSKKIITGSADQTARIWNSKTGDLIHILSGHTHWVLQASFSPDGSKVITGSADRTARIWDSETGDLILTLSTEARVQQASLAPDGKNILTASGHAHDVQVWNLKSKFRKYEAKKSLSLKQPLKPTPKNSTSNLFTSTFQKFIEGFYEKFEFFSKSEV